MMYQSRIFVMLMRLVLALRACEALSGPLKVAQRMVHSASLGMLGRGSEACWEDWGVGGWEVRLFLGWSVWVVEVPEPPQERERMARSSTKYFMEGFISEMSGGRGAKGVGEIVKCVKNVKLRAGAGLEVVGDALVVEFTAFHTPFWLHEGPP